MCEFVKINEILVLLCSYSCCVGYISYTGNQLQTVKIVIIIYYLARPVKRPNSQVAVPTCDPTSQRDNNYYQAVNTMCDAGSLEEDSVSSMRGTVPRYDAFFFRGRGTTLGQRFLHTLITKSKDIMVALLLG